MQYGRNAHVGFQKKKRRKKKKQHEDENTNGEMNYYYHIMIEFNLNELKKEKSCSSMKLIY